MRFTRSAGKSKPRGTPPYVLSAAEALEKHVVTTHVNLLKEEVAMVKTEVAAAKGENRALAASLEAERAEKEAAVGESLELRKAIQDYLDAVEEEAVLDADAQCPSLYLSDEKGRGRTGYFLVRCANDVHADGMHSDDFTTWSDEGEHGRIKEAKR